MSEASNENKSVKETKMPLPLQQATDYFLDQDRGDAYGLSGEKNQKRNFFQNLNQQIGNAAGNIKDLAGDSTVVFGFGPDGKGDYFRDGVSVTKGFWGNDKAYNAADIFKARRANESRIILNTPTEREKVTGVTQDGGVLTSDVVAEGLSRRARNAGFVQPGSKYYSPATGGVSNAADLQALQKAVQLRERVKDLVQVASDENIAIKDLKNPEGKLKSEGKIRKLIADQVRKQGLRNTHDASISAGDTQLQLDEKKRIYDRNNALKEHGITTPQLQQLTQPLPSSPEPSPQALAGLTPNPLLVQQRAATGLPKVDALIDKHFPINGATAESLLKSLDSRKAVTENAAANIIAGQLNFESPTAQYNRALGNYNENRRIYERKQDRIQTLEDAEALYQHNLEKARMDHEMRQYEIREENKMRRAQYETELEIAEENRASRDFDNLTRMIMGMAGSL